MTDGQKASDPHSNAADTDTEPEIVRNHRVMGHYARQLFDVQKQRIMAGNRVSAMEREGWGDYAAPARATVLLYAEIEKVIEKELVTEAKKHFMADWIAAQRGIGLPGFARLLGVTGNIDRFPTVSKLWKYLGLHVTDGHAPRRVKGESWSHTNCGFWHLRTCKPDCKTDHHPNCVEGGVGTAYAPQGRVLCHQIAESIVKLGDHKKPCEEDCAKTHEHRLGCPPDCPVDHAGPYRRAYDERKAIYESDRLEWTQAHRHNAAMRFAVKLLVKNLWIEWHTRRGHPRSDTQSTAAAPSTAIREPVLV